MKDAKKNFVQDLRHKIYERIRRDGISKLSEILKEMRVEYLTRIQEFGIKDPEQSWKPFKGSLLEDLILETISTEIRELGFEVIKGDELEKEDSRLTECQSSIKRSLVVDFGEYGMHLPDVDLVIYDPENCKAKAIISSKATLRERVAQTGYWFLKLQSSAVTKTIRIYFITLDEDGDLKQKSPCKKGRAIAEKDTHGTFVITDGFIEESQNVKKFEKFIEEIKKLRENDKVKMGGRNL